MTVILHNLRWSTKCNETGLAPSDAGSQACMKVLSLLQGYREEEGSAVVFFSTKSLIDLFLVLVIITSPQFVEALPIVLLVYVFGNCGHVPRSVDKRLAGSRGSWPCCFHTIFGCGL